MAPRAFCEHDVRALKQRSASTEPDLGSDVSTTMKDDRPRQTKKYAELHDTNKQIGTLKSDKELHDCLHELEDR
jgi:hypothetical protein